MGLQGGANFFELINFTLDKKNKSTTSSGSETERTGQKIHTPSSLFWKVRKNLAEQKMLFQIYSIEDIDYLKCGDFVEFEGIIRRNPLTETINRFISMFNLMESIQGFSRENSSQKPHKNKGGIAYQNNKPQLDNNLLSIKEGLLKFREALNSSNDLYGEINGIEDAKAIFPIKNAYYNDFSIQDLINGQFKIIGRVTQVLSKNSDESIDLLRNTGFNGLSQDDIKNFLHTLSSTLPENIIIPTLFNEIKYPGFQIIPISIYR